MENLEGLEGPEKFDRRISETGLDYDYFNAWFPLSVAVQIFSEAQAAGDKKIIGEDEEMWQKVKSKRIERYEDYLLRKGGGAYVAEVVGASRAKGIAEINALVTEFNEAREDICERRDLAALRDFVRRAHELIYGKK